MREWLIKLWRCHLKAVKRHKLDAQGIYCVRCGHLCWWDI
jgi:hypothetical protein